MSTLRNHIIVYTLLLLVILIAFGQLFQTFYQQDEWLVLGNFMVDGFLTQLKGRSLALLLSGQMRILAHPIHYLFYSRFPFNVTPFVVSAIAVHFINTLLVFRLWEKLSKDFVFASLAAFFFSVPATAHQALSWSAASMTTLPSATFVLVAILLYLNSLANGKSLYRYGAYLTAIISFLFKESSFFVFLLFPVLDYLYEGGHFSFTITAQRQIPALLYAGFAFCVRLIDLIFNHSNPIGKFSAGSSRVWEQMINFAVVYPLAGISQLFVHPSLMFALSQYFEKIHYPDIAARNVSQIVAERIVADTVSIVFSVCIIAVITLLVILRRKLSSLATYGILLTLLSFLPFVIMEKGNAYLESRYYYLAMVGGGCLFAILVKWGSQSIAIFFRRKKRFYLGLVVLSASMFVLLQISLIQKDIAQQAELAKERKAILAAMHSLVPTLPQSPVFYITGTQDYYMAGQRLPFQQGIGYTLMVWYYNSGKIPVEFIKKSYLWNMGEHGYQTLGNRGFGYVYDEKELVSLLKTGRIHESQVVAFAYDGQTKHLTNQTSAVRLQLAQELLP